MNENEEKPFSPVCFLSIRSGSVGGFSKDFLFFFCHHQFYVCVLLAFRMLHETKFPNRLMNVYMDEDEVELLPWHHFLPPLSFSFVFCCYGEYRRVVESHMWEGCELYVKATCQAVVRVRIFRFERMYNRATSLYTCENGVSRVLICQKRSSYATPEQRRDNHSPTSSSNNISPPSNPQPALTQSSSHTSYSPTNSPPSPSATPS